MEITEYKKIYIKGDIHRVDELRDFFKEMGAKNYDEVICNSPFIHYFIGNQGLIDYVTVGSQKDWLLRQCYKEAFLPGENIKNELDNSEVIARLERMEQNMNQIAEQIDRLYSWYKCDRYR